MTKKEKVKIRVHKSAYKDIRELYREDLKDALREQAKSIFKDIDGAECYHFDNDEYKRIRRKWLGEEK